MEHITHRPSENATPRPSENATPRPSENATHRSSENITHRPLGLSTSQAAQELGVSLGTIRRWSDLGYLQSYRTPGGQRRFSHQQIAEFVASLEQDGRSVRISLEPQALAG